MYSLFFFFNDTATTEIYTLSLHDALPICDEGTRPEPNRILAHSESLSDLAAGPARESEQDRACSVGLAPIPRTADRKSTRLNSSHANISYAVFCLKKKKKQQCLFVTTTVK